MYHIHDEKQWKKYYVFTKILQCFYRKFVEERQNLLTIVTTVRYDKFQMGKFIQIATEVGQLTSWQFG
ncbi:hypothetical protein Q9306_00695 [Bacillus sp. WLY-B-L8]|nr:hypothetical protein [Bacillus sp. WLY-B-L8]